jgi:hypothetical protein
MKPSDFFSYEEIPEFGGSAWFFDSPLVEELRTAPKEGISDLEAAFGLTQLAHEALEAYGTSGKSGLYSGFGDEGMSVVLRTMRAVLGRVGIAFEVPFRNFNGFRSYWKRKDMGGSWEARRTYLDDLFNPVLTRLEELEDEQAAHAIRGVDGELKNIIFASTGPKPRIVLRDAMNNVIEVVENAEYCLFYDRPLSDNGLTWAELADWWKATAGLQDQAQVEVERSLYRRLAESLASPPEQVLFRTYCERYRGEDGGKQPALLPQVYLHYDPRTRRERGGQPSVLVASAWTS